MENATNQISRMSEWVDEYTVVALSEKGFGNGGGMKTKVAILICAVLVVVSGTSALSANLAQAPVIAKYGKWSVRRALDPMTDKASCVALYGDKFNIQVTDDVCFISESGKGGVQSITLRFDDRPPQQMQLANDVEKDVGAIGIRDNDFQELLTANRLRYQVLLMVGGLDDGDLDLNGLAAAHQVIMGAKCGH